MQTLSATHGRGNFPTFQEFFVIKAVRFKPRLVNLLKSQIYKSFNHLGQSPTTSLYFNSVQWWKVGKEWINCPRPSPLFHYQFRETDFKGNLPRYSHCASLLHLQISISEGSYHSHGKICKLYSSTTSYAPIKRPATDIPRTAWIRTKPTPVLCLPVLRCPPHSKSTPPRASYRPIGVPRAFPFKPLTCLTIYCPLSAWVEFCGLGSSTFRYGKPASSAHAVFCHCDGGCLDRYRHDIWAPAIGAWCGTLGSCCCA